MRSHKDQTVKIAAQVMQKDPEITARAYDELMPMFSDTGKFDSKALAVLTKSFVELGTLPTEPIPSSCTRLVSAEIVLRQTRCTSS